MKAALKKRTAPKEERQQQLIQATIRSVSRNGLSDTTMATVAGEAGLSQGIINLHFKSKERLLVETLAYIADEYRESWEKALSGAGDDPAEKLAALVAVDFKRPVCDQSKLAVWFAFWSETKSRPTYRRICSARDLAYRKQMVQVCEDLIKQGKYTDLVAETVTACISAMTAGCWLELLTNSPTRSRQQAMGICMSYLVTTFPGHFADWRVEA
jgi:AcrR family transcriptional regulator